MWDSPLTITGVIATVLSLVFAGAAFWNARRQRMHAPAQATAKPHAGERIQVRPREERAARSAPPATPRRTTGAVFKQVGTSGKPPEKEAVHDSGYVWE